MVPAAYAPGFHHNDLNVGVFRQNADLSEIIDDEILTTKDELAPNGSIMDRSDGFLYEEQPVSSCIDFFTGGYYGSTGEHVRFMPGLDTSDNCMNTKDT